MITINEYQEALKVVQDYEKSLETSKQEIASILEEACAQRNLTYEISLSKEEWFALAAYYANNDTPVQIPIKLSVKVSNDSESQ